MNLFSSSVMPGSNKRECLSLCSQFQVSLQIADVMSNFRLNLKTISRRNALAYSAPSSVDRKLLCISFFIGDARNNKLECLSLTSQFQFADEMSNFRLNLKTMPRTNTLAYSSLSSVARKLL